MRILILAIATTLSFGAYAGGMAGKGHGCAYSGDYQAKNADAPKVNMDQLLADAETMKADHDKTAIKADTALGKAAATSESAKKQ